MTAAAGAGARIPARETRRAYRVELLCTLRRAREELGRWPTAGEWELATSSHVSWRTYVRNFRSWRRACRTAARLKPSGRTDVHWRTLRRPPRPTSSRLLLKFAAEVHWKRRCIGR
jgi:hypothetical protein